MVSTRIGILHPGQMGASVGAAASAAGADVARAGEGRGDATRERARAVGLVDAGALSEHVAASDVLISVCPPVAAMDVASRVSRLAFQGLYVDANAIAPRTAVDVARVVEAAGARFVDGGIIGPPPERAGTTRLYLSGRDAGAVAALFEGSALAAVAMQADEGTASWLAMNTTC
jgi:3-hydroxyisobutyrate dehydrogenase-like beta-hydroxyacid dehydrogenase